MNYKHQSVCISSFPWLQHKLTSFLCSILDMRKTSWVQFEAGNSCTSYDSRFESSGQINSRQLPVELVALGQGPLWALLKPSLMHYDHYEIWTRLGASMITIVPRYVSGQGLRPGDMAGHGHWPWKDTSQWPLKKTHGLHCNNHASSFKLNELRVNHSKNMIVDGD